MFDQRTAIELTQARHRAEPKPAIRALHKSFGSLEVVKGVSVSSHEHDVISILGASGLGKSTLLRCINFLEAPTKGRVALNGEPISARGQEVDDAHDLR